MVELTDTRTNPPSFLRITPSRRSVSVSLRALISRA